MVSSNNYLTKEDCKKIIKKIDIDNLFDKLMVEYKNKTEPKKMKIELVKKEK